MNIDLTEFQQSFFEEAKDLLVDFEAQLLRLEEHPSDPELLNAIFRCAHSIKGGSATFGLPAIAEFTHGLETVLDKVRNGVIAMRRELIEILFECLDMLRAHFAYARGESSEAPADRDLIARTSSAAEGAPPKGGSARPENNGSKGCASDTHRYRLRLRPGAEVLRKGADPLLLLKSLAEEVRVTSVECDESALPDLEDLCPELSYLSWTIDLSSQLSEEQILAIFEFIADESEISLETVAADRTPAQGDAGNLGKSPARQDFTSLRVSADKLDRLINLVGELVINQSMLSEVTYNFSLERLPRLFEAVSAMERASRELQERAMAIRLVPIRQAFGRFPRLVRDIAASTGKQIELKTSGEETELDKSLIDALADPLTHLVRNSADHGIEPQNERSLNGKPACGTIALRAFQEGGNIVIEVADDGRGLDRDRILSKAISQGYYSSDDPVPSDDTIYSWIFEPGFSTATSVTDVSGRGVGMDIVRQALASVNGSIGLTTRKGEGTVFRIRLPLTMAILDGLSLAVGNEVYVIALTNVVESIRPGLSDFHRLSGGSEVVQVRGQILPLLRLYDVFQASTKVSEPSEGLLVILENDGRKVALLVDQLIGQSQVVIKSIEANHRKVEGIAGATILGDGRVALILDVPGLFRIQSGFAAVAA